MVDLVKDLGLERYLYKEEAAPTVPLVHVAGTKGKGSVATMVAAMLTASGYRTGLYTSPHLYRLEERFRVDGQPCSKQQIVELVDLLRSMPNSETRTGGNPSFFEMTTAMGLLHFDREACDAIVLEVGLGGRLDCTNVCAPSLSVITSIGLDHQHVLGDSLVQIATEKAGIVKLHVPVVSGVIQPEPAEVVQDAAKKHQCDFFQLGCDFDYQHQPSPRWGSKLEFWGKKPPLTPHLPVSLSLEGEHQARNAALAVATSDVLREQGMTIQESAVKNGLSSLKCEGRIERFDLPGDVLSVVDAAHNRDSIAALCECLRQRSTERRICVVFGTSLDKSAEPMLTLLAEVADELVLTRFHGNPRFRDPEELRPLLPDAIARQTPIIQDPIEACRFGLQQVTPGGTLAICGSFFLAAETRPWILNQVETRA